MNLKFEEGDTNVKHVNTNTGVVLIILLVTQRRKLDVENSSFCCKLKQI